MSCPQLLQEPPTNSGAGEDSTGGHNNSCASYVEAATTVLSPATYATTTTTANELAVNNAEDDEAATKAAALDCTPTLRHFTVEFSDELETNELVGLTGDTKTLGEWQLERALALSPQANRQWSGKVMLPSCANFNYRYFIYVVDEQGNKQIRRWETQMQARTLKSCETNCRPATDHFGEIIPGETQVKRGWLTNETIVQLQFEREKMFQIVDINKFDPENVQIKVVPLAEDLETLLDSPQSGVNIAVVKMKYGDSQLNAQQSFGVSYKRGEIVIFHVTVPHPVENSFALVFHNTQNKPMGKTIIRATDLTGSEGVLELTITEPERDSKTSIARLTLPYLIVQPYAEAEVLDFRTTYAHYWPKSWPNLDVGHRGNGRSYIAEPPAERENTIASFLRAYESHADMIELDVHLTADGVPVIYHDYGVRTAPRGKVISRVEQLEYVLLKDLTYEALKQLRVFAVVNSKAIEYPGHNFELRRDHRIFPTLVDILEGLPKSLGIDVEIKWPQLRASGEPEAITTIDKNFFVDRVLSTILEHGCGRPLIFSSFDADICTMLRFKQNMLPVMFLTMGETKKWSPFMDLRTRNFEQALNNAQAFELAGTAPHAEDFLSTNGADMMQQARNLNQITVVWGDDCNSVERVAYFNKIGAQATCYDRTDLYVPRGKERAFFNDSSLMVEFEGQCRT